MWEGGSQTVRSCLKDETRLGSSRGELFEEQRVMASAFCSRRALHPLARQLRGQQEVCASVASRRSRYAFILQCPDLPGLHARENKNKNKRPPYAAALVGLRSRLVCVGSAGFGGGFGASTGAGAECISFRSTELKPAFKLLPQPASPL